MARVRVFWHHPQLRDYRMAFFEKMHQRYDLTFFFQRPSYLKHKFRAYYSVQKKHHRWSIALRDVAAMYKHIKQNDMFICSFLLKSQSIIGVIIATLFGKPKIIWEELWYLKSSLRHRIKYRIMQIIARLCDSFFVMGVCQKNALCKIGISSAKIFMANEYPGFIYSHVPGRKIGKLEHFENTKVILYIGRFVEFKGINYLIDAFCEFLKFNSEAILLLVGYGPLEDKLRSVVASLGLTSIYFHEPIFDVSEKSYLFNKIADIVVVPSIITESGQQEGGPLVVLEALSAGCPVVGTNALGNTEQFIVQGQNGFIVPHSDSKALSRALDNAIRSLDNIFSREAIISSFHSIKGHEFQAEVMTEAIDFALKR